MKCKKRKSVQEAKIIIIFPVCKRWWDVPVILALEYALFVFPLILYHACETCVGWETEGDASWNYARNFPNLLVPPSLTACAPLWVALFRMLFLPPVGNVCLPSSFLQSPSGQEPGGLHIPCRPSGVNVGSFCPGGSHSHLCTLLSGFLCCFFFFFF